MKVLVIDDSELVLLTTQCYLRGYGIRTTLCDTAEEAYKALASQKFDIILIDYILPGERGDKVAERIRGMGDGDAKLSYLRSVPLICYSSMIDENNCPLVFDGSIDKPLRDSDVRILFGLYGEEGCV